MSNPDTLGQEWSPLDAATRVSQVAASLKEDGVESSMEADRVANLELSAAGLSDLHRIVARLGAQAAALEARSLSEEMRSSRLVEQLSATLARQVGVFLADLRRAYRRLALSAAILALAIFCLVYGGNRCQCALGGGADQQAAAPSGTAGVTTAHRKGRTATLDGRLP